MRHGRTPSPDRRQHPRTCVRGVRRLKAASRRRRGRDSASLEPPGDADDPSTLISTLDLQDSRSLDIFGEHRAAHARVGIPSLERSAGTAPRKHYLARLRRGRPARARRVREPRASASSSILFTTNGQHWAMADHRARSLRRNSTDAERRLWRVLRGWRLEGYKFRRQHPIGRFIVDFACMRNAWWWKADVNCQLRGGPLGRP